MKYTVFVDMNSQKETWLIVSHSVFALLALYCEVSTGLIMSLNQITRIPVVVRLEENKETPMKKLSIRLTQEQRNGIGYDPVASRGYHVEPSRYPAR